MDEKADQPQNSPESPEEPQAGANSPEGDAPGEGQPPAQAPADEPTPGPQGPQGPPGQPSPQPSWRGPIERLEMAEPSVWTRGLTITAIILALGAFWAWDMIVAVLQAPEVPWRLFVMVVAPPVLFVLYVLWRWWDTPKERRAVVFEDDHVVLPASHNSKREERVAYEDIEGIMGMQRGPTQSVLVDFNGSTVSYSTAQFEREDAAALLQQELMRRIHALPNADEIISRMRERQKLARIASSKPATVTKVILGILAAYFGVELWMGALDDPFGLIALGANAPALIDEGQYFRLISANFLHGGWVHIILNGVALLFLGAAVEKLMGSWRLVLIYLLGAIGGSLGSYLGGPGAMSVGSSTAIFGLFGAFLAIHLRFWRQLTPPFRQSITWWVVIIGINAGLPIVVPVIDYMAHLTGMLAGGLVAYAMLLPMDRLKPNAKPSGLVRGITVVLTLVFAAGLVRAGIYATDAPAEDRNRVFAATLEEAYEEDASPDRVNEIAWMTAIDEDARRERLEQAREATARVVEDHPERYEIHDTLATLNYRLAMKSTGEERLEYVREAIQIEVGILDQAAGGPEILGGGQATYASQLARFLDFHRQVDGPLVDEELLAEAPSVEFARQDGTINVEASEASGDQAVIYAVAKSDGRVEGLVRTCLAAGQSERAVSAPRTLGQAPENLSLESGLVTTVGVCPEQAEFWPMAEDIAELP